MKKVVVSIVSAAALASFSLAMAGGMTSMAASDQVSNNPAGIYVGANFGYGKYDLKNSGIATKDLRGFTWFGDLGYQFNQYVAVEGNYTQFKVKTVPGSSSKDNLYGVGLMAKGILPINEQFDVFAKAGAMDLFTKTLSNGASVKRARIVPAFGVGTDYNVTQNVALTLQGITTLAMKGPNSTSFTMPATYAAYAGVSYKFNV